MPCTPNEYSTYKQNLISVSKKRELHAFKYRHQILALTVQYTTSIVAFFFLWHYFHHTVTNLAFMVIVIITVFSSGTVFLALCLFQIFPLPLFSFSCAFSSFFLFHCFPCIAVILDFPSFTACLNSDYSGFSFCTAFPDIMNIVVLSSSNVSLFYDILASYPLSQCSLADLAIFYTEYLDPHVVGISCRKM